MGREGVEKKIEEEMRREEKGRDGEEGRFTAGAAATTNCTLNAMQKSNNRWEYSAQQQRSHDADVNVD